MGSLPLCGGTFARPYLVSIFASEKKTPFLRQASIDIFKSEALKCPFLQWFRAPPVFEQAAPSFPSAKQRTKKGLFKALKINQKRICSLGFEKTKRAKICFARMPISSVVYIYIYIYAAGCLKKPQILTPFARNMRKRSAKCVFFFEKSTQFWLPRFAVLLSTHDFVPIFFLFFFPLFSGGTRFLLWSWCPELRETWGGARFAFFSLQTRGAAR